MVPERGLVAGRRASRRVAAQAVEYEGDHAVRVGLAAWVVVGSADALQGHHDGADAHVVADGAVLDGGRSPPRIGRARSLLRQYHLGGEVEEGVDHLLSALVASLEPIEGVVP
jgi:hypothetical protein